MTSAYLVYTSTCSLTRSLTHSSTCCKPNQVRGLLNATAKYPWKAAGGGKVEVCMAVLVTLCTFSQSKLPYRLVGVDANDELYCGNDAYTTELNTYVARVMDDVMTQVRTRFSA